jgi:hypothetical protein
MISQRPFSALCRPFRARIFVQFPNPGRCPGLVWFAPLGHRSYAPKGHPIPAKGNALVRRSALISAAVTGKIDVREAGTVLRNGPANER